MSVDKFGRHFNITNQSYKKGSEQGGLPLTPDGGYNMGNKLLHNIKDPISENDAVTKGFLLKNILKRNSEGNYDFNNKQLVNIKDPTKLNDAVTLGYIKRYALHKGSSNNHFDAGSRIIRNLSTPVLSKDAATMEYVNNQAIQKTSEGDYNFNNKRLHNVQEPKTKSDAATKGFVEMLAIKRTDIDNDYDMGGKRIRNVASPLKDSDVVTKKYVMEVTPFKNDDHWEFFDRRLSNVGDPLYIGEAVNLRTMYRLSLSKKKDEEFYDSNNLLIRNLGTCQNNNDAVNKLYVDNTVVNWNKENDAHLQRLGRALFNYIHRPTGKSADIDPNIDQNNFLDWNEIHKGENSKTE